MQDHVTVNQAAQLLGVSRSKIWSLMREGRLQARQNPLDKRERLIALEDIDLLRESAGADPVSRRAHLPRSIGLIHEPSLQSEEFEDLLTQQWRPS